MNEVNKYSKWNKPAPSDRDIEQLDATPKKQFDFVIHDERDSARSSRYSKRKIAPKNG